MFSGKAHSTEDEIQPGEFSVYKQAEMSKEDSFEFGMSDEDFSEESEDDINQRFQNATHSDFKNEPINSEDARRSFSVEDGDRIMFEKSGQTVNDVVEMIIAYHLRFGSSLEARKASIEMFKICAGPDFKHLNLSNYKLSKVFDPPSENINYHFYCGQCTKKILMSSEKKHIKGQFVLCNNCKIEHCMKLSNPNNFVLVDFEYQLRTLMENDEIAEYFNPESDKFLSTNTNTEGIHDVHDSILYKNPIKPFHITITYILSTDKAPLFHISKRGFWPLQILLNNLPVHLRFKFVLLVGIMIVKTEPKPNLMNLFIDEFWKQGGRLHFEGIEFKSKNSERITTLHFTPIFVVADSIAKPILQNRLQFNGYYGCSYCYHGGLHVKDKGMKYPFLKEEPELRTHMSHMSDLAEAVDRGLFFRGVKGESAFNKIPDFDMVWGFPLDYLHNALFGVTEQMWNNCKIILTPAQRRAVDDLLLLIEPPRDLRRSTEKISNKSIWKATNWKAWMLYFCLPICSKFISSELLQHFALFINSMFTLLKMDIMEEELDKCEQDLLTFVARYETFYGVQHMTFNVHAIMHLVNSIRQSGPLWATSAFPFENNIYFLKECFNVPKSVEQQMTKSLLAFYNIAFGLRQKTFQRKHKNFQRKFLPQKYAQKVRLQCRM